ncbi:uncharacterized protein [Gossypium hirsutum]|uniref:Integrase zinc-binding domain-containing protein n=1 Tax=Gossypium hirsutum TaxID=3635 RepID=A0ABM3BW97_GOSHI|nr:uncharacterized protein LOC121230501 [Gossypium hirsutum]
MLARLSLLDDGSLLAELQVKLVWVEQIKSKQLVDATLGARFRQVENGKTSDFGINSERVLCFRGRMCIPKDDDLRKSILREVHSSLYAMHPGGNKMYQNLCELYWWPRLKREVMEFGPMFHFMILEEAARAMGTSWEDYLPLAEFAYNNSYQASIGMDPYEALYGQRCRTLTCWTELGKQRVLGPQLVADIEGKVRLIQDRLKEASDRQKSYAS